MSELCAPLFGQRWRYIVIDHTFERLIGEQSDRTFIANRVLYELNSETQLINMLYKCHDLCGGRHWRVANST